MVIATPALRHVKLCRSGTNRDIVRHKPRQVPIKHEFVPLLQSLAEVPGWSLL